MRSLISGVLLGFLLAGQLACAGRSEPPKAVAQPAQMLQQGMQAWRDDELHTARLMFMRALTAYRSIDHAAGQWQARVNLASVALVLGEHEQARAQVNAAFALGEVKSSDHARLALLLAQADTLAGDWESAQNRIDDILQQQSPASESYLTALFEGGRIAGLRGQSPAPWIERIELALSDRSKDLVLQASLQRLKATAAAHSGDHQGRRRHLLQALELDRVALYRPGLAASHRELGLTEAAIGDWNAAQAHMRLALDIRLWLRDRVYSQQLLLDLSEVAEQAGDDRAAADYRELSAMLQPDSAIDWAGITWRMRD